MDSRIVLILIFGLVHGSLSVPQKELNSVKDKTDPTKAKILKQINRVNDDGSYTFGYEADDSSFRVETRSKDGVVKGKYGFLDPAGELKTVEYTHGEKTAKKDDPEYRDQELAGATTDSKTVKPEDDGSYNENQDYNAYDESSKPSPIDRQDVGGRSQYLRQVTQDREEQPQTYTPTTTQLSGGRFSRPEEDQYQGGPGASQFGGQGGPGASQFGGQQQYPQQFLGGGSPQQFSGQGQQFSGTPQPQFASEEQNGRFSPGQLQQFVGNQPSQFSGLGQQQFSGAGGPQQFSGGVGGPQQFSGIGGGQLGGQGQQYSGLDRDREAQLIQQRFSGPSGPQSPYTLTQQQYLEALQQGGGGQQGQGQFLGQQRQQQFDPQQFGRLSQQGRGSQSEAQNDLVGGIGRPDLQNYDNIDPSQYAGAGQQQFGGPNRFSSAGGGGPNELGFQRRPSSIGSGGSTQEYVPNVELDGFSEDADQDGYVDTPPGTRSSPGDAKSAQAAEKTAAVKTPDGERVVTPGQYNPQALGPQGGQGIQGIQGLPPGGQLLGGQGQGGISPYDEQILQQIYQQQAQGGPGLGGPSQAPFPASPQSGLQNQPQSQFQGQSPYQGQGINGSPYQGQGILGTPFQGQGTNGSPYQGQGINGSPYQGQGILPQQFQGQGILPQQFQGQGPQQFQGQGPQQFQGGQGQFQGQPEFQQGRPQFQQGGGQSQFSPQGGPQFSPEFQGGAPPQQFLGGGRPGGLPVQGGQYLGGGFQPNFAGAGGPSQLGPIPPQYFQGGRGQQFSPGPYSGGIQSASFPFDYNPYGAVGQGGQGGFQGSPYPGAVSGGQQGGQIGSPSSSSTAEKSSGGEEKKV